MALNITSPINTFEGIVLNNAYARIEVMESQLGTSLLASIKVYPSWDIYKAGAQPLNVKRNADYSFLNPIQNVYSVEYNREVDGSDILAIAHQAYVDYLAEWGISATITSI